MLLAHTQYHWYCLSGLCTSLLQLNYDVHSMLSQSSKLHVYWTFNLLVRWTCLCTIIYRCKALMLALDVFYFCSNVVEPTLNLKWCDALSHYQTNLSSLTITNKPYLGVLNWCILPSSKGHVCLLWSVKDNTIK
jgi:hypothetical protein